MVGVWRVGVLCCHCRLMRVVSLRRRVVAVGRVLAPDQHNVPMSLRKLVRLRPLLAMVGGLQPAD